MNQSLLQEFDEKFPIQTFLNGDESSEFDEDIIAHREGIKRWLTTVYTPALLRELEEKIEGMRKKQPLSDEYLGSIFSHGLHHKSIAERDLPRVLETREVKGYNQGLNVALSLLKESDRV